MGLSDLSYWEQKFIEDLKRTTPFESWKLSPFGFIRSGRHCPITAVIKLRHDVEIHPHQLDTMVSYTNFTMDQILIITEASDNYTQGSGFSIELRRALLEATGLLKIEV